MRLPLRIFRRKWRQGERSGGYSCQLLHEWSQWLAEWALFQREPGRGISAHWPAYELRHGRWNRVPPRVCSGRLPCRCCERAGGIAQILNVGVSLQVPQAGVGVGQIELGLAVAVRVLAMRSRCFSTLVTSSFCAPVEPGICWIASSSSVSRLLLNWRRSAERASALRRLLVGHSGLPDDACNACDQRDKQHGRRRQSPSMAANELAGKVAQCAAARRHRKPFEIGAQIVGQPLGGQIALLGLLAQSLQQNRFQIAVEPLARAGRRGPARRLFADRAQHLAPWLAPSIRRAAFRSAEDIKARPASKCPMPW